MKAINREPRINSITAANGLGVQHRQFMKHVKANYKDLVEMGFVVWGKDRNRKKFVTLNFDHMFLLVSCFRNTGKARDYKIEFAILYSKYRKGFLFSALLEDPDYELVSKDGYSLIHRKKIKRFKSEKTIQNKIPRL